VLSSGIESYVIGEHGAKAPADFEHVNATIRGGVPSEIQLGDGWSVVVYVPTGIARPWLQQDVLAHVTRSDDEHRAVARDEGAIDVPAARLVVRRGGPPVAAVPLVSGMLTRVVARDGTAAFLDIMPLAWDVRVSAMIGGADAKLRVELAWRTRVPARFAIG
jgi:hypothetical protein